MSHELRIAELESKLAARVGPNGIAGKGYGVNVRQIRRELARLANLQTAPAAPIATSEKSAEPHALDTPPPESVASPANTPIFRRGGIK